MGENLGIAVLDAALVVDFSAVFYAVDDVWMRVEDCIWLRKLVASKDGSIQHSDLQICLNSE